MRNLPLAGQVAALLLVLLFCGCPTVPIPEPGGTSRDMPLIDLEINDSPETIDDYTGTTAIPCRMRLNNHNRFSTAISVRLKNIDVLDEKIRFSTTSGGSSAGFLLRSVPADGSWVSFFVRGTTGNLSGRDKDAVIEVAENRVNARNVILARKGMMITNSPPPLPSARVEVQYTGTPYNIDDYLTWSPHYCRARIVNHAAVSSALTVRLQNMSGGVGQLRFATASDLQPTTNATDPAVTDYHTAARSTLDISLPANGEWREFYVAGAFGSPSVEDKDAVMEAVVPGTSTLFGRWPAMVRIRKNGNTLADVERDRFLEAVRALQPRTTAGITFDRWQDFLDQHNVGGDEGHGGPGFLPWHRVYLLRLERDLQALDPSVTIPYWKFDTPAPNIFHRNFMGDDIGATGNLVDLAATNPLSGWEINTGGSTVNGIIRNPNYNDQTGNPPVINEIATFSLGSIFDDFTGMEGNPHGTTHVQTGGTGGWLRTASIAPRDPLFFFLHGHVDHLWAKWQIRQRRTMHATFTEGYSHPGAFPGSGSLAGEHIGHYLEDEMWPWNAVTGTGGGGNADRPATGYGHFPQTVGYILMMPGNPRPYDVIDYRVARWTQGSTPKSNQGIGFAYDDVPFVTAL